MNPEERWNAVRSERTKRLETAGMSVLRITLLFGSAVVAFALLVTPILDMRTRPEARAMADLDMTSTGSIQRSEAYTIRRSVLQPTPDAVCIIRANGQRSGQC